MAVQRRARPAGRDRVRDQRARNDANLHQRESLSTRRAPWRPRGFRRSRGPAESSPQPAPAASPAATPWICLATGQGPVACRTRQSASVGGVVPAGRFPEEVVGGVGHGGVIAGRAGSGRCGPARRVQPAEPRSCWSGGGRRNRLSSRLPAGGATECSPSRRTRSTPRGKSLEQLDGRDGARRTLMIAREGRGTVGPRSDANHSRQRGVKTWRAIAARLCIDAPRLASVH